MVFVLFFVLEGTGRLLQRPAKATPMARPDETLAVGRLASTPEGDLK